MLNKKAETDRLTIAFGLIVFYIIVGIFYVSYGFTIQKINDACINYGDCPPNINSSGYTAHGLGSETNTLLGYIFNSINGLPLWLNIVFGVFSAMMTAIIIILLLHG